MGKKELLAELERQQTMAGEIKGFLIGLRGEQLLVNIYSHDPAKFLETAAEYLEINLAEMQSKLRMS